MRFWKKKRLVWAISHTQINQKPLDLFEADTMTHFLSESIGITWMSCLSLQVWIHMTSFGIFSVFTTASSDLKSNQQHFVRIRNHWTDLNVLYLKLPPTQLLQKEMFLFFLLCGSEDRRQKILSNLQSTVTGCIARNYAEPPRSLKSHSKNALFFFTTQYKIIRAIYGHSLPFWKITSTSWLFSR